MCQLNAPVRRIHHLRLIGEVRRNLLVGCPGLLQSELLPAGANADLGSSSQVLADPFVLVSLDHLLVQADGLLQIPLPLFGRCRGLVELLHGFGLEGSEAAEENSRQADESRNAGRHGSSPSMNVRKPRKAHTKHASRGGH